MYLIWEKVKINYKIWGVGVFCFYFVFVLLFLLGLCCLGFFFCEKKSNSVLSVNDIADNLPFGMQALKKLLKVGEKGEVLLTFLLLLFCS